MPSPATQTLLFSLALFAASTLAQAADTSSDETALDWQAINLAVTDAQVLPAYTAFATTTADLLPPAEQLCAAPAADSLAAMQEAFHPAMDAWQSIQHIHFGPVTYFNWNFRIQYWPDERNSGTRQLDALLASEDPEALQLESFARQSVGVQGFPALERLLFEEDALQQVQASPYRCALITTIAANLADMAAGVEQRWRDEFRATVADEAGQDYYESARDAGVDFYKALVETLRKNQEQKLVPVLGASPAELRLRRAESWRAERSLRNLRLNLQALNDLYQASSPALADALPEADRRQVADAFSVLLDSSKDLPDGMAGFADTVAGHVQLQSIVEHMAALYEALEAGLKNTDLYLGFNSLDGD